MLQKLDILLSALFLFSLPLLAPAANQAVQLDPEQGKLSLGSRLLYLEDPEGQLEPETAREGLKQGAFRPTEEAVPNFGYSSSTYWFHLAMENPGLVTEQRYLEVGYPLLDHLSIYLDYSGKPEKVYQTGDQQPFASRPVALTRFLFPLKLAPHERVDILIRLQTGSASQLQLNLWTT